jgi:hypothetical protein
MCSRPPLPTQTEQPAYNPVSVLLLSLVTDLCQVFKVTPTLEQMKKAAELVGKASSKLRLR